MKWRPSREPKPDQSTSVVLALSAQSRSDLRDAVMDLRKAVEQIERMISEEEKQL